jgi:O-antigen/teichoic acid export membrane protein
MPEEERPKEELGVGGETVRNFSSMFSGTVASILVSLLIYISIARLLGPSDYGVYTFAFGFGNLAVGLFGGFGIGNYLVKNITEARTMREGRLLDSILASGYTIIILITLALMLIGVLISGSVSAAGLGNGSDYALLIVALFAIFFGTLESVSENALVGFGKANIAVATMVGSDFIWLFVGIALILLGYGVMGALIGLLLDNFFGFLAAIYFVVKEKHRYGAKGFRLATRQELYDTVRFSAPIGMKNLVSVGISNFAIVLLGLYVSKSMLGDYGVAMTGFAFVSAFYGNVTHVMLQSFSKARTSKEKEELNKTYGLTLKYSLILVLPIFVYMIIFANPGVYLIFSHKYVNAPLYLSLIVVGVFINTISIYMSTLFISEGKTAKVFKYSLISALVQVFLLIALVPRLGPIGSISAIFIIGSIVNDILYIRGTSRLLLFSINRARVYRVLIANMLLGLVTALALLISIGILSMLAGFMLLISFYPIILALLKIVDRGDIEKIRGFAHMLKWIGRPIVWFLRYTDFFIIKIWGQNAVQ